jgi:hypothetical protein
MVSLTFDASGKVSVPPESELGKIDEHTYVVAFTNGTMADGRPYYAYIAVKPSMYQEFYDNTVAKKPMVLSNYGSVIVADFMQTPPKEIIEFMRSEFGFEDNFEDSLRQQVSAQRKAYIKENEIKRTQDIVNMMKQGNYQANLNNQLSDEPTQQKVATTNSMGDDQKLKDIIAMMKKNQ